MAPRSFFRTILWLIDRWIFRDSNKLPRKLPFFGVLPAVLFTYNKLHDAIVEHLQMIGRTSYLIKLPWFVNMDIVGTVDPDDVYHVMIANFANYPKGPEMKRIFHVLGDGIFTSDFDPWKNQRKLTRLLINHQRFQKFMVKTNWDKVEQGLIPVLEHFAENSQIVDMQDVFQRLTFDTTSKFITGYDPGCLAVDFPEVEFAKAMDEVEEAIVMRYFLPENVLKFLSFVGIGRIKTTSKAYATLDQAVAKYISMKKEELKKGNKSYEGDDNGEGFDLLTSYVKEGERMGMVFDDKFFRDTILNLMIAGRDTTSSGLTWFLWLVSTHPEVEKKIREELKASISPSGEEDEKFRIFKFDEIKNLVYLHAALCETLRLYPPVPFQHKTPLKPDILPSGLHVTPKMKVMFPLYAMGRMESIWGKDCKEFKPERWISERGRVKHEPSHKFLAFNAGPRTCLGKEVAFTQMKAVAAAIIHNYNIQLVEGHPVIPNVSVILYIKNGLKVRVTKRWK